ncbi:MAG: ShlB/FhaC/HecB family hemolysin secretion/activation protein, partial [Sphingomonas sp.]
IRDRAASILTEAGYVAAVEVPEQRIAEGRVRFNVVMARLTALRVRGDAGRAERLIASYLQHLTEPEVFNRYQAERYLLLAGDLPGYNVRLALRSAGTVRGEVVGEVVVQRLPALVDLTVQNLGSSELGRWGALARAQFFGLTGLGDRTLIAAFTTPDLDEQQTLQLAHDFRVGGEGLRFGGQMTFAWARPDLGDPALDIRSHTIFANVEMSYPFIRRQTRNLLGTIGLDYVDQDIDFGALPLNRDRLRVAFARVAVEAIGLPRADPRLAAAEPFWRLGATVEVRQGLDILGATQPCGPLFAACLGPGLVPPTRLEGDPTALVFRSGVDFELRPAHLISFAGSMRAQYSGHPLLSFEEFSAGNYTVGRGYDPGAILGDRGVAVRGELRFGTAVARQRDAFAVQPFIFVDQAWTWNEERLFFTPRQELTSIGGGIRAAYGDQMRLELLVAAPLDRTAFQPNRNPRILLSITTRLWPWSFR